MNPAINSRGQALVETVFALPIIAIVLGVGLYLMYLTFAQAWMTRSAREAAACLVTNAPANRCRARLESTLKVGVIFGRADVDVFRTDRSGSHVQISLDAHTRFVANRGLPQRLIAQSSFPRQL